MRSVHIARMHFAAVKTTFPNSSRSPTNGTKRYAYFLVQHPFSNKQVVAIITQPPLRRVRGRKLMPSPAVQFAFDRGLSPKLIFTRERDSEEWFLAYVKALEPELCVTAAYGNSLSTKFLKIPTQGCSNC